MTMTIVITLYIVIAVLVYIWMLQEFHIDTFDALCCLFAAIMWIGIFVISCITAVIVITYSMYDNWQYKRKQ